MPKLKSESDKSSVLYKLWVLIQIPPLFIYYTILQPLTFYFKDLIAEQSGSIRYEKPQRAQSQSGYIKKAFVIQSVIILLKTIIRYIIQYWWMVLFG